MSKTYFQYQGTIKSQAVAEAIAFPVGIGPFMGFARLNLLDMMIYPDPDGNTANSNQGKYYDSSIWSQNYGHCVGYNPSDSNRYKFGLITRSGHIYVSEQSSMPITVLNSSAGRSELIVMALYKNIEEPINNIPTLVGYWNNGASSFYEEFFLNTVNPSEFPLGGSLGDLNQKTFKDLYDRVTSIVNVEYQANMVLIGVYGEGINPITNESEPFSIVPYGSKYPYSQPFTPAMYYTLKGAIDGINSYIGSEGASYPSLKEYIKSLLPEPEDNEEDSTLKGVPIGTILMWTGSVIPEGWALCDGSNGTPDLRGRFPLGENSDYPVNSTGGSKEVRLTIDNIPAHKHTINRTVAKIGDNNHMVPLWNNDVVGGADNWGGNARTTDTGKENPDPINLLNPYAVVKFIMRIS